MKIRQLIATVFAFVFVLAMTVPAPAQGSGDSTRRKLEGAWLLTATFVDPPGIPPFKVLLTFASGKTENEGTLMDTNEFQLTPNPVCSPDQGVWARTGNGEYVA